MRFRIVGLGRAGGSFAAALSSAGWTLDRTYGRNDDVADAAKGVDLLLICVPDRAIAPVAKAIAPGDAVVVHIAGSQTLDSLTDHDRHGSIHPLMTLPDAECGAARLLDNCPFAVAGDQITGHIAEVLGGWTFHVPDDKRMLYHAAAAVASNHLVALTAQVQRLGELAGVPKAGFGPLMTASLTNALESDVTVALTGPVSRADWPTVRGHLQAVTNGHERDPSLYLSLAAEAAEIAGHALPEDLV